MHGIDKAHMLIFCLFLAMVFSGPGLNAQVRISELMYHPEDPGHEFLELVNTGSSAEDLSGWGVITGIDYVFPPGTTLAPGERLVVCKDRAALSAATGIDRAALLGDYGGSLDNGGETILLVNDSARPVDEIDYDNEAPWDSRADGLGPSLERLCLAADSSLPGNWRASGVNGGTPLLPGADEECPPPPLPSFSSVVINEIHYHPPADRDETEEFIELYNREDAEIDLHGWRLADGIEYEFDRALAPTVIPPGGFLLVARDPEGLAALAGIAAGEIAGPWDGKLSNYADEVELRDARGRRVDRVAYSQDGLWPARADGLGSSLQRVSADFSGTLLQNWKVESATSCSTGIGGEACVLFENGVDVRWFQNTSGGDPGFVGASAWFEPDFNDETNDWLDGRLAIGFAANAGREPAWLNTRSSSVQGLHSILIRIEFFWDPAAVDCETNIPYLSVDQDDGFVAWLNGVEVARGGMRDPAGSVPAFDGSYRAEIVTAAGAGDPEPDYRQVWSGTPASLRVGRNVLAVGNYNSRNTSSDLFLSARMTLGAGPSRGDLTPGSRNSVAAPALAPMVLSAEHEPAEPTSADGVTIRARVDGADVAGVSLTSDAGGGEETIEMRDDGLGVDSVAADGIWAASLAAHSRNTIVKYRVEARNSNGCSTSYPRAGNPSPWTGYYVQDNRPPVNENVRLFYIFTPGSLADLSCSSGARRAGTFVDFRGRVYFDVDVKFRGETACNYPKKPIRVEFNKGDLFDGQSNLNFNAAWNDKAMLREKLGFGFLRDAGIAYSETHLARVHTTNGVFHGAYFTIEDPSDAFLRRNGWDNDGALYKCRTAILNGSTAGYEPRSSSAAERLPEVQRFATDLNRLRGQALIDFIDGSLNVEAFIDYQAVQVVIIDGDSVVKNWLLYNGPHGIGKAAPGGFTCFAWDIDLSHGQMYLTQDQRFHNIHPLFQTQTYPFVGQGHHGIVNAVLQRAPRDYYVKAYYGRMWTLLQEKFSPAVLLPKIDAYDEDTISTAQADLDRWRRTWGSSGSNPGFWRNDVRSWFVRRFNYLVAYLQGDNPTTSGRRFQYTPAPRLRFTEIDYNPGRGGALEFLELRNLESTRVDISGWSIPAVDYTFPPGSEAPADGFLIVARDPDAFTSAHRNLPVGMPVFGPFEGRLADGGEEVRLRDNGMYRNQLYYPETIDVLTYRDESPWPTEADGEGRSIELRDLAMDNDYAESWQPSFVDGGSPGELTRSNSPPVISLFISARSGDAPLLVNFDATLSFDPDGDPFTVSWDFGDGAVGAGEAVTRTYRDTGVFQGSVTLDDGVSPPAIEYFEIFSGIDPNQNAFVRGDANLDGVINISDPTKILFGLFGLSSIDCERSADVDDDGSVAITDAIVLLNYLFRAGSPPAEPSPSCGIDSTADNLGCRENSSCL